jgi:preprotein translocase subunit SecD
MQKNIANRFYLNMLVVLLSVYFLLPTLWSLSHPNDKDKMPAWLPASAMRLGLDLKGGIHLVMGVDLDEVVEKQTLFYVRSLEKDVEKKGVTGLKLNPDQSKLEVSLVANSQKDADVVAEAARSYQVLDFVGQQETTLVFRLAPGQEQEVRNRAIDQSIETIRNRIDEFGVSEPIITRKGDSQVLVQFPGADDPERLKNLVGETAKLNFHIIPNSNNGKDYQEQQANLTKWIAEAEKAGNYTRETFPKLSEYRARLNQDLKGKIPENTVIAFEKTTDPNVNGKVNLEPQLLSTVDFLSGEYIDNAVVSMDQSNQNVMGSNEPIVSFSLNPAGAPLFAEMTRKFVHYRMAIVLDDVIKSAPTINSAITGGSGQITLGRGDFEKTMQEAKDLSIVLRAGALPAKIEVQEERVIGPSIGLEAIESGRKSLIVASVIIFAFMWLYYGSIGLVGNLACIANVAMIFAILGALGATLTLPGIAGIVLTIGMAVDALIIIFERMREELRAGRNTQQMIEAGFDKAYATILDSNLTTAAGAFVLLEFGTGSIRGFALTLLIGIVANIYTASVLAKALIKYVYRNPNSKVTMGLHPNELESHA